MTKIIRLDFCVWFNCIYVCIDRFFSIINYYKIQQLAVLDNLLFSVWILNLAVYYLHVT